MLQKRRLLILRAMAYKDLDTARKFMGTERIGDSQPTDVPILNQVLPSSISDINNYAVSDRVLTVYSNVESILK